MIRLSRCMCRCSKMSDNSILLCHVKSHSPAKYCGGQGQVRHRTPFLWNCSRQVIKRVKITVFWDVTPCRRVAVHGEFRGRLCFHPQGKRVSYAEHIGRFCRYYLCKDIHNDVTCCWRNCLGNYFKDKQCQEHWEAITKTEYSISWK